MIRSTFAAPFFPLAMVLLLPACSSSENLPSASNGGVAATSGGSSVTMVPNGGTNSGLGGAMAGGTTSSGGTATGSGGGVNTGGVAAGIGGASSSGGASAAMGGRSATSGGATVGGASTGGKASVGGSGPAAGGKANGGGQSAAGGRAAAGATNTGGATSAGGAPATAGASGKPFRGVASSNCAQRTALNVSWYYNWETAPREPCSSPAIGGEYVPMIKGNQHRTPEAVSSAITSIVNAGYTTVLGFNEPNKADQGNQTVALSISLWPSLLNPALRVGSPATSAEANPGQAWFTDFMDQVNANSALRVDFIAVHWYGWNAGSCDASATQLENYVKWIEGFAGNRPLWITEFGCMNQSNPDEATVVAFFKGALAMFAKHPRIERYAWYPWNTNNGLVASDGSLTSLGTVFATAPAYK